MKPIVFSEHAKSRMALRGASEAEVIETISSGRNKAGKQNRMRAIHRFEYNDISPVNHLFYKYKTVDSIFVDEIAVIVVITVKVYYYNEEESS